MEHYLGRRALLEVVGCLSCPIGLQSCHVAAVSQKCILTHAPHHYLAPFGAIWHYCSIIWHSLALQHWVGMILALLKHNLALRQEKKASITSFATCGLRV